jgi:hypothetical protein
MSQDYNPSLVTRDLAFCGDAAMKSTASSATLLYDKVNDNNGTMYNGSCLNFDGTDEYVLTSGYFGALAGDDDVTLCAWINVDTSGDMGIISIGNVYMSIIVNGGYLEARCYNAGSVLTNTDAHAISTGTWYHVAGVFSGGNVTLYKDGVATAAVACSNQNIAESSNYFQLGKGYTSGYLWMDGEIANPMAFNAALSANNIKELYEDSKVIIPTKNDASGGFVSQTNLKGFWTFAEGAGDICYDGSGRGIHGTFQNMEAADWSTGQTGCPQLVEGYNRPITFNVDASSTDYVDTGDVYAADEMTLVAWVNMSVVPSAAASAYPMLFGKRGTDTQRSYFLAFDAANKLYWEIKDAAAVYYVQKSTKTDWNANQWYHIAVNYVASTGIAKMYIDGVEDAGTFSPAQPWSLDPIPDTSATCRIGGGYYYFEGIINEAAIYNKALGATDMAALAATDANGGPLPPDLMTMSYSTSSTSSSNVIGYWRNDNNVTWTDLSGNGKTGTVTGSPPSLLFKQGYNGSKNVNTGRDGQGFPLRCQNNGAIGFKDGSNDHVTIPTSMDFQVSTLLLWVKFTELGRYFISSTGASPGYYQWYVYADGKLQFEYSRTETGVAASSIVGTAGDIVADTWYHLGVILDSGGATGTMYKDGNLLKQSAWSTTGALTPTSIYAGPTSNSFGGQIANVQIYDRALTYAEIQQNYKSFKTRFGK